MVDDKYIETHDIETNSTNSSNSNSNSSNGSNGSNGSNSSNKNQDLINNSICEIKIHRETEHEEASQNSLKSSSFPEGIEKEKQSVIDKKMPISDKKGNIHVGTGKEIIKKDEVSSLNVKSNILTPQSKNNGENRNIYPTRLEKLNNTSKPNKAIDVKDKEEDRLKSDILKTNVEFNNSLEMSIVKDSDKQSQSLDEFQEIHSYDKQIKSELLDTPKKRKSYILDQQNYYGEEKLETSAILSDNTSTINYTHSKFRCGSKDGFITKSETILDKKLKETLQQDIKKNEYEEIKSINLKKQKEPRSIHVRGLKETKLLVINQERLPSLKGNSGDELESIQLIDHIGLQALKKEEHEELKLNVIDHGGSTSLKANNSGELKPVKMYDNDEFNSLNVNDNDEFNSLNVNDNNKLKSNSVNGNNEFKSIKVDHKDKLKSLIICDNDELKLIDKNPSEYISTELHNKIEDDSLKSTSIDIPTPHSYNKYKKEVKELAEQHDKDIEEKSTKSTQKKLDVKNPKCSSIRNNSMKKNMSQKILEIYKNERESFNYVKTNENEQFTKDQSKSDDIKELSIRTHSYKGNTLLKGIRDFDTKLEDKKLLETMEESESSIFTNLIDKTSENSPLISNTNKNISHIDDHLIEKANRKMMIKSEGIGTIKKCYKRRYRIFQCLFPRQASIYLNKSIQSRNPLGRSKSIKNKNECIGNECYKLPRHCALRFLKIVRILINTLSCILATTLLCLAYDLFISTDKAEDFCYKHLVENYKMVRCKAKISFVLFAIVFILNIFDYLNFTQTRMILSENADLIN